MSVLYIFTAKLFLNSALSVFLSLSVSFFSFSLSFYLSISFLFQKASLPLDVNILCFIIRLACSVCDFQTAQKSNLARHMASKHSQDLEGRLLGKHFIVA